MPQKLLTDADIDAIVLSLRVSICAVALMLVPAILLAAWLAGSRKRIKSVVEAIVLVPLILPPVITGIALLSMISRTGLNLAFTWWAAVLASATAGAPLLIRTFRAGLETIDPRLAQVAATLGASRIRIFFTVTLPAAWPALVGGITLAWARALGEFGATLIVAGNIAGKTQTIPLAMYTVWQTGSRSIWPLVAVAVTLALAGVGVGEWLIRQGRKPVRYAQDPNHQAA